MPLQTDVTPLFRDNAYLRTTEATVVALQDDGGIVTDRTIFYATSGGQPGDTGRFLRADGSSLVIERTVHGATKADFIHYAGEGAAPLTIGETITQELDWDRRYRLMKMHTACHLVSVICPFPITGAAVNEDISRVDLDLPDPSYTKEYVTEQLMKMIGEAHPVYTQWISEEELLAHPEMVKSKNVRPPMGMGRIRLVCIGEKAVIDSQPCGGTHVANTSEIGDIHISKIEKKGRENRRFRISFGTPLSA